MRVDFELMTPREAAGVLRVCPATVRRWAREGSIPSVRIGGGCLRIPSGELRRLVIAQARGREVRG